MAAIFLTYHEMDSTIADELAVHLESIGHKVKKSATDAEAGEYIDDFIKENIKNNSYIITIFSANIFANIDEINYILTVMLEEYFDKKTNKFIPIALDDSYKKPDFYVQIIKILDHKIKELKPLLEELEKMDAPTEPITDEIQNLKEVRNAIGKAIRKLKRMKLINLNKGFGEVSKAIP